MLIDEIIMTVQAKYFRNGEVVDFGAVDYPVCADPGEVEQRAQDLAAAGMTTILTDLIRTAEEVKGGANAE
ncbi:MAG: hypothetical protein IKZ33_01715 [Lentisphaeria bacterium]|nr:hypothetical protein [Lentisphaeria bacterium]